MTNSIKLDKWQAADIFERGYSLYRCGKYLAAVDYFRLLTAIQPKQGRYWASLGYALKRAGKIEEATECLKAALLVGDATDVDVLFTLAEALKEQGEDEAALAALQHAIPYAEPEFKARLEIIEKVWSNRS